MAVTITDQRTMIADCDSTTSWTGSATVTLYTASPTPIESTGCLGMTVSNATQNAYFTLGASVNFTTNPSLIYVWIFHRAELDTTANGGLAIQVGDGTNRIGFHVAGSDVDGFRHANGPVGWQCLVMDTANLPTASTAYAGSLANLNWAAITQIGVGFKTLVKSVGGVDNCFWDILRYGKVGEGLLITAGTAGAPGTFEDIATADRGTGNLQAYGILRKLGTGVYGVQGPLTFGDTTGTTASYFADTNATLVFEDRGLGSDKYSITVQGNATGSTTFQLGTKVGSGDTATGSDGCVIQVPSTTSAAFTATDADLQYLKIYGSTLSGFGNGITLSSNATNGPNHEFIGNIVRSSGIVDIGRVVTRNCTFTGTTAARQTSIDAYVSDDGGVLTTDTTDANSAGANDILLMPTPTTVNDATYFGWLHQFNRIRLNVGTAGVGTYALTWEYWNGSSWATLTVTDGTGSFKTAGTNNITFTPPGSWARNSVNDLGPYYFVRARNSTAGTMTTQPLGTQVWLYGPADGSSLLWNANIDIKNSNFTANTNATNDPHGIKHDTAGSFTYDNLKFSSNDYDINNASAATVTASYAESNQNTTQALGNATTLAVAQSFTGDGNTLSSAQFYLSKTGTPTGTLTAKIYAHSGSYGTSSVPTGAVLATSTTLNVANLTTTLSLINLFFETTTNQITLTNATNYVVVLDYSNGNSSNYVNVGVDTTTPTHGGNLATYASSTWSAVSGTDMIFKIRTGGIVTLSAINGTNVGTYENTGWGSTNINNSVSLTVTNVVQNTQCYIVPSAGGSELLNAAASTLVSGNIYKATTTYNYTSDTAVTIRAREMGYLPFETSGTITTSGLSTTAVWLVDPNWKLVVSGVNISFTNPATITRASGDFGADGWIATMSQVTVEGSATNNGTYTLSAVGTTTLTITGATLNNAGAAAGITLTFTRRSLT